MSILGYARSKLSKKDLQDKVRPNLKGDDEEINDFLDKLDYESGAYDKPDGYQKVSYNSFGLVSTAASLQPNLSCCQAHKTISAREDKHKEDPKGRLFYLALPPSVYPEVVQGIKENCTDVDVGDGGFLRIIAEKPFGKVTMLCCTD